MEAGAANLISDLKKKQLNSYQNQSEKNKENHFILRHRKIYQEDTGITNIMC